MEITIGVYRSTTASFTRNALETPVVKIIIIRRRFSVPASFIVWYAIKAKKPSISRTLIIIIIPMRRAMVLKSIAEIASSKVSTPNTIMATEPKKAADGLSIFTPGKRVNIIPVYVMMNIIEADDSIII